MKAKTLLAALMMERKATAKEALEAAEELLALTGDGPDEEIGLNELTREVEKIRRRAEGGGR